MIMQNLLPAFEIERSNVNHGSPYRKSKYSTGHRSDIESIDILGLNILYLKSQYVKYKMCPIFGLVPSSISM